MGYRSLARGHGYGGDGVCVVAMNHCLILILTQELLILLLQIVLELGAASSYAQAAAARPSNHLIVVAAEESKAPSILGNPSQDIAAVVVVGVVVGKDMPEAAFVAGERMANTKVVVYQHMVDCCIAVVAMVALEAAAGTTYAEVCMQCEIAGC